MDACEAPGTPGETDERAGAEACRFPTLDDRLDRRLRIRVGPMETGFEGSILPVCRD